MQTKRSLAPISLAALVGAGVGAAGLALVPRGGAPADPAREKVASLLRAAEANGLSDGVYRIEDPMRGARERQVARDPVTPSLVQILFPERPTELPKIAAEREFTHHMLGDVPQFLSVYSLVRGPFREACGTAQCDSYEFKKSGEGETLTRRISFEITSGDIRRLVERDGRGALLRSFELVQRALSGWTVTPVQPEVLNAMPHRPPRLEFGEFVERVNREFPLYEPALLPPQFHRSDYGFDDRPPRGDPDHSPLPLAWIAYTDGVVRMSLLATKPEHMKRLEDVARQQKNATGSSTCATSPADTPDNLLAQAGEVLIHRRDDGCRIVLRRDDLDGVAVVLVGYRGLSSDDYVRSIRSLSLVSATPAR